MSDEAAPITNATEEPGPPAGFVCPYCGADPITIKASEATYPNGLTLGLASCQDCRTLVPGAFLRPPQSRIESPRALGRRIH